MVNSIEKQKDEILFGLYNEKSIDSKMNHDFLIKQRINHVPSVFLLGFHVYEKWPHLRNANGVPTEQVESGCWAATAMTVINMRGAIALGRKISVWYSMEKMFKFGGKKIGEGGFVEDIFSSEFGGAKKITRSDEHLDTRAAAIKSELMKNGPVAVAEFRCTKNFKGKNNQAFNPDATDGSKRGLHTMVILGWRMAGNGQEWIVKNSWGNDSNNVGIAFGQNGIDENVIVPQDDMVKHGPWQSGVISELDFAPDLRVLNGLHWEESLTKKSFSDLTGLKMLWFCQKLS